MVPSLMRIVRVFTCQISSVVARYRLPAWTPLHSSKQHRVAAIPLPNGTTRQRRGGAPFMETVFIVWTAVLIVHLPVLALPMTYWHYSDRDPIRCQGPTTLLYQSVLTVLFTSDQIVRCLVSRMVPVALEVPFGQSLLALMVLNMLFYVVRLYVAFSKTAQQIAAHETMTSATSPSMVAMKRHTQVLNLLIDRRTAVLYTLGHLLLQNSLQVTYMLLYPGLAWSSLYVAEQARPAQFDTLLNIGLVLDMFPVIAFIVLAWKLRVVVDAFGIKSMLRKIGWCSLFAFTVYILTTLVLNAVSDLYIPYMISVFNLDMFMYFAFIQPVCRARRSPPHGKAQDGVRPSELARGTEEFIEFLRSPPCLAAFEKHLEAEFCIESLLFWADVEAFRSLPQADMVVASEVIFDKYLRVDAPFGVNLPSRWLHEFRDVMFNNGKVDAEGALSATMFDGAAQQIVELMYSNSLGRFKEAHSTIWGDFQHARHERNVLAKLNTNVTGASRRSVSSTTESSST